ncbi:MAG: hypothetical protein EPO24_02870 [Bacteroidetes bacterium]|nr:MAG: hypothetical protein EPO24_02870 [Bacteroidota bacterium]
MTVRTMLSKVFLVLSVILFAGSFQACNDEDEPPTGELAPPSNLRAYPRLNAVRLAWNHSSTAHYGNFAGYQIVTRDSSSNEISSARTQRGDTSYIVQNLVGGELYFFSIQSVSNDNVLSDTVMIVAQADTEFSIDEFAPPGSVKALSKDGAVTLSWQASKDAGSSSFAGYNIMAKDTANTVVKDSTVGATILTATITQLTNGEEYTFFLRSKNVVGTMSKPLAIRWGPTARFSAVRIYEFETDSFFDKRGLQFSTGQTFDFVNGNQQKIDLWIDGSGNTEMLLRTPSNVLAPFPGWRTTRYAATSASSMDEIVEVPAIESFITDSAAIVVTRVYFAYTQEGNYVRFQVINRGGVYPNRFLEIAGSYNSGFGVWAKHY